MNNHGVKAVFACPAVYEPFAAKWIVFACTLAPSRNGLNGQFLSTARLHSVVCDGIRCGMIVDDDFALIRSKIWHLEGKATDCGNRQFEDNQVAFILN